MFTRHMIRQTLALATLSACCLAQTPAASSLLVANFDFESTDAAAAWKEMVPKGAKPSTVSLDTDNPHSGKAALKFQAAPARQAPAFVFTGINLPADHPKKVRVRIYARTAGIEAGQAEINLLERDRSKVLGWAGGKEKLITIDAGNDWKEFSAEVPVRAEARVLTLFIRIQNPTADARVWVDDLSVEFVEGD